MAKIDGIREGQQVLGSDGGMVGEVAGVHGNHIHVRPTPPIEGDAEHVVPQDWVSRVDTHVHLDREAALVRDTWTAGEPGAARAAAAAPVRSSSDKSWLLWLIGGLLLLMVIILGVRGCFYAADDPNYEDNAKGQISDADRAASGVSAADAGTGALDSDVGTYLASPDATPRTFTFRNLNFDTGSAEIRSEYRDELSQLGQTLAANKQAKMRVVGYADARGDSGSNQDLGKRRADAVASALVASGVAKDRIEAASGGESHPKASNQTAEGQFENRRTELVILSR